MNGFERKKMSGFLIRLPVEDLLVIILREVEKRKVPEYAAQPKT